MLRSLSTSIRVAPVSVREISFVHVSRSCYDTQRQHLSHSQLKFHNHLNRLLNENVGQVADPCWSKRRVLRNVEGAYSPQQRCSKTYQDPSLLSVFLSCDGHASSTNCDPSQAGLLPSVRRRPNFTDQSSYEYTTCRVHLTISCELGQARARLLRLLIHRGVSEYMVQRSCVGREQSWHLCRWRCVRGRGCK